MSREDPEIDFMEEHHAWCSTCGDYFGNELYEREHAEHDGNSPIQDDRTGAIISDDEQYRYRLSRTWDVSKPTVAFVMLNPSTADATEDDPTIRRCIGFAEEWDFGRLVVGNLFALRSPKPELLEDHPAPIGPENDTHLQAICAEAETVVAAWGARGDLHGRAPEVCELLDADLHALDTTKAGHPNHPLYQPADAELTPYTYTGAGDAE